ncbi:ACP S-malonyltransferase [Amycolatopsis sp. NPDC059657]|uniref:ACP S-malonyltransferase n=1 Tax=Amycolatopsis sp. NPDC059657 TaxID=3346899 RepID=UPI00366DD4F1
MGPSRFEDVAKFMVINPFARKLVALADERLGYSLVDRYRETEGDYSEYAQVAFLVNCLALAQWSEATLGLKPDVCVGPSFGGKAAAVYSGALSFTDGVWMTQQIARCLDDFFAKELTDIVTLSFARTPEDKLKEVMAELENRGYWHEISCTVDHDFQMLCISEHKIDELKDLIRAAGGMPMYLMRPPMHSTAFGALREKAEAEIISKLEFGELVVPVIADQDGTLLTSGEQVRKMLLDGFNTPVNWLDVVSALQARDIKKLYVSGQDGLFGRVAVTTKNFDVVAVNPRLAMQPRRRGTAA